MRNKYKLQVVKPEKKTGGFISKLGIPIVSDLAGAIGLGKTGAGVSGAGHTKKTSSWIEHVKSYAKAHNISYKKALTEAKPSYKK